MITVCYNAEKTIRKTIESVLNQSRQVYEYILVDGESKDSTNQIIEEYRADFEGKGIRYIHISEKDKGISDAFNKGIKYAQGDFVGLINADDELLLETNKVLNENVEENVDVLYGNCLWIDEIHGIEYERKAVPRKLKNIRYEMVVIHPSTFIKKCTYEKYGLYRIDYKHCMDEELLTRLYEGGAKFKYINNQLTIFRAGGISDSEINKTLNEGLKLALERRPANYIKAYNSYIYKYIRYKVSTILKDLRLYKAVRKDVNIID